MKRLYSITIQTPNGDCTILATEKGICFCSMPGHPSEVAAQWAKRMFGIDQFIDGGEYLILNTAVRQLQSYNEGNPVEFTGPFDFHGAPFQNKVWQTLTKIPYGKTKTYGQIAKEIGQPDAARAVGTACGANPIAILVPCHRVVGSTGKLTGYAGGLATKEWLLTLEQNRPQQIPLL